MNTRNLILGLITALTAAISVQAQAASGFGANPDLYGHVLVDPPKATTDASIERGQGDSYGHVLLDARAKATTDVAVERGYGDSYGSVLLDVAAV